jgi:hypothetical protein
MMEETSLEAEEDTWAYNWGVQQILHIKDVKKKLIGHHPSDPAFKWIWKSCYQPKHKVFS